MLAIPLQLVWFVGVGQLVDVGFPGRSLRGQQKTRLCNSQPAVPWVDHLVQHCLIWIDQAEGDNSRVLFLIFWLSFWGDFYLTFFFLFFLSGFDSFSGWIFKSSHYNGLEDGRNYDAACSKGL